jgi:nitroreductase
MRSMGVPRVGSVSDFGARQKPPSSGAFGPLIEKPAPAGVEALKLWGDMTTTRRQCLSIAGAAGAALAPASAAEINADMLDLFFKRQTVRKYKSDPVPEEHLVRILDAASRAPCTANLQPWKFLVVRDKKKIEKIRDRCMELAAEGGKDTEDRARRREGAREHLAGRLSAPVLIVVLTDSEAKYPGYRVHDGPLVAGYLCLAARAYGYGTLYMTDSVPDAVTRETLHIPDRYKRVMVTPLGVPDGWPKPMPKKKIEELIAYESL